MYCCISIINITAQTLTQSLLNNNIKKTSAKYNKTLKLGEKKNVFGILRDTLAHNWIYLKKKRKKWERIKRENKMVTANDKLKVKDRENEIKLELWEEVLRMIFYFFRRIA